MTKVKVRTAVPLARNAKAKRMVAFYRVKPVGRAVILKRYLSQDIINKMPTITRSVGECTWLDFLFAGNYNY